MTGASSGMGFDAAMLLCELGYTVAATVRKEADGERLRAAAADPERMHPLLVDVTDAAQVAAAVTDVERLIAPGGRLAGMFSNAGIALMAGELSAELCPIETQQRVMEVNFWGAVRAIRAFLPLLREARGTLVVNSALMARTVLPYNAGYAASKCALEGWVDGLRREVHPLGVRVTLVEAAAVSTSLEAKQDLDAIPATAPYAAQRPMMQRFLAMQASRRDDPACAPRRVSEKVAAAIQSSRPPVRTIVGGGARPIWLLGALPDRAQDVVMTTAVRVAAGRRLPRALVAPSPRGYGRSASP